MFTVNRRWRKRSELGAEVETGELLYGIVRLAKPELCAETGTGHGDTAFYIATALGENGAGHLHTAETDPDSIVLAREHLRNLPATVHATKGIDLIRSIGTPIDFAFIDSWWVPVRIEEIEAIHPKMSSHGILVLHDTCQNYGNVHDRVLELTHWQHLVFQTPYGVSVFQKGPPDFSYRGRMVDLRPL